MAVCRERSSHAPERDGGIEPRRPVWKTGVPPRHVTSRRASRRCCSGTSSLQGRIDGCVREASEPLARVARARPRYQRGRCLTDKGESGDGRSRTGRCCLQSSAASSRTSPWTRRESRPDDLHAEETGDLSHEPVSGGAENRTRYQSMRTTGPDPLAPPQVWQVMLLRPEFWRLRWRFAADLSRLVRDSNPSHSIDNRAATLSHHEAFVFVSSPRVERGQQP